MSASVEAVPAPPPRFDLWGPGVHIFTADWCGHCTSMKHGNKLFQKAMDARPPKGDQRPPHTLIQTTEDGIKVICHELVSKADKADAKAHGFFFDGFPSIIFKLSSDDDDVEEYSGSRIISNEYAEPLTNERGAGVKPPKVDIVEAYRRAKLNA
jgi:hypothetical protein